MSWRLPAPREVLAGRLRRQAEGCLALGSPFYGALLVRAADDVLREGPAWDVLAGRETEPATSALPLRFMAAVNRLVLLGDLPALARLWPSAAGAGDDGAAWQPFRRALIERREDLRTLVDLPCQTNEVGRSASLLGGFLEVSRRSGLPLRLLELGSSAGLNLLWDRYRYEAGGAAWGDPRSAVRFPDAFEVAPDLDRSVQVATRKGCDVRPIDPCSAEGALTLRSFLWPDQRDRIERLEGALRIARRVPVAVETMAAGEFLAKELATPVSGVATVVYHSVFQQYVGEPERSRMAGILALASSAATADAPVHLLTMEPAESRQTSAFEVRLDGELLGTSSAHGGEVRWLLR